MCGVNVVPPAVTFYKNRQNLYMNLAGCVTCLLLVRVIARHDALVRLDKFAMFKYAIILGATAINNAIEFISC